MRNLLAIHRLAFLGAIAHRLLRDAFALPSPGREELRARSTMLSTIARLPGDQAAAALRPHAPRIQPREFDTVHEAFTREFTAAVVTPGEVQPAGIARFRFHGEILGVPDRLHEMVARCHRVELYIDSPGGTTPAALRMIKALRGKPVLVQIESYAGSAAALLAMAGTHRRIRSDGHVMIHAPSSCVLGTAEEFRREADQLDLLRGQMADVFCRRTGQPLSTVREWLSGPDHVFDAPAALAAGLVDEIIPAPEERVLPLINVEPAGNGA